MTGPTDRRGLAAEGVESLGRIRRQGIALLILAFITGAIAGGAIMRMRDRSHDWHMSRDGMGYIARREGLPPGFEALGLSASQKAQITEILKRRRPRTDSLLRVSLAPLHAMIDSTRAEIRAVLTPEQRAKMDTMFMRRRGGNGRRMRGAMPMSRPFDQPGAGTDSTGATRDSS
jgi:Spy/CpxP family protein refolding chaperone